ncbi:unnamed protein product, partial [Didymodactylos carnosus]
SNRTGSASSSSPLNLPTQAPLLDRTNQQSLVVLPKRTSNESITIFRNWNTNSHISSLSSLPTTTPTSSSRPVRRIIPPTTTPNQHSHLDYYRQNILPDDRSSLSFLSSSPMFIRQTNKKNHISRHAQNEREQQPPESLPEANIIKIIASRISNITSPIIDDKLLSDSTKNVYDDKRQAALESLQHYNLLGSFENMFDGGDAGYIKLIPEDYQTNIKFQIVPKQIKSKLNDRCKDLLKSFKFYCENLKDILQFLPPSLSSSTITTITTAIDNVDNTFTESESTILSSQIHATTAEDMNNQQQDINLGCRQLRGRSRTEIYFDPTTTTINSAATSTIRITRTTTSPIISSRPKTRTKRSQFDDVSSIPIDDNQISSLYRTGFDELCGWLEDILKTNFLLSMTTIQEQYRTILRRRHEPVTELIVRTSAIQDRITTRYGNQIKFETISKRTGTFACWNDLTTIARSVLTNSTYIAHTITQPSDLIYKDEESRKNKQKQCEILFQAVNLLREAIKDNVHYLKKYNHNYQLLSDLAPGMFWDCVPTMLKNFIGLLTTNQQQFQQFKRDYKQYDLLDEDI